MRNLKQLLKGEHIVGLTGISFEKDRVCSACVAGKQLKKKHPIKSIVTTSRPLELLHLDLFGPSHYDTLGGSKYGLVIVDDYSRYSWVFLLKSKDETHREFITFAKKAQRTYESEIKAIRTDNGTEFKNYTMQEFVDDEGIKHEFSAPYTPQQNGVVERKNRTIIEMARTMLSEFNSPHNFWGEAISTAVHYSNRLFLRPLHNKTPYELLTGNKPNVMYIRVFGCKCLVKNNKGKCRGGSSAMPSDRGLGLMESCKLTRDGTQTKGERFTQLWQLTPNSILHLSIFVTVCEAFLGIDPHWGLWRKIFYVKRHNDSNGPPVVGGVGFVVRKEVDYLDYPMKESVQGWRNKWFYLRDPSVSGRCSNLPPFEDKLIAKPKKSWQNTLSPDEKLTADRLFDQIVALKNTGGLTMCGTEVVSVFLQRRVQPLMSRPHQLWLYSGKDDESRVISADLSADDLRDEVRRLTCLSKNDNIVLISARPPYDADHLPTKASSDDDDDEVPLAKRAKLVSERAVSIPPSSSRAGLFSNPSSNDESGLVRHLRDQVSSLDKDITSLRAMAALVKKKGETAIAIEQYALDGLHIATESLGFVASDAAEENKKIHEEVEAMTDVAHPNHGLWLHRPKAVVMAKFKYRVGKAHYYFDKFHAHLTMVWNTLFPLDQAPETLSALFTRFKSPERIRQLVEGTLGGCGACSCFDIGMSPVSRLGSHSKY
ncbi:hypothetical protein QYE76_031096 [Lolium multiflorum]|uniref:Integrase catalytic domain-containing protein n=1 Tax=Lolium multiflorum TaxID=4521 RepID=A0AAD8QUK5_LOLMU|nr:hypothetical protein QYE76_031096 [Lolium multiflorum]